MIKQLTRSGNSYALVLDRAILDLIKVDPATPLDISTDDGKRLILTPVREDGHRRKVREAMDWTNKKHAKTLKRLAE